MLPACRRTSALSAPERQSAPSRWRLRSERLAPRFRFVRCSQTRNAQNGASAEVLNRFVLHPREGGCARDRPDARPSTFLARYPLQCAVAHPQTTVLQDAPDAPRGRLRDDHAQAALDELVSQSCEEGNALGRAILDRAPVQHDDLRRPRFGIRRQPELL